VRLWLPTKRFFEVYISPKSGGGGGGSSSRSGGGGLLSTQAAEAAYEGWDEEQVRTFDGAVEERLHREAMEGATHPASPNSPLRSDLPPEFVPEYRTAGNPFVPEAQGGAMRNPFGPIPGALQAASDPAVDPARAAVKQRILQALQLSEKKARKGGNRTATGRESPSGGAELLPHQATFNWLVREEQVDAIMDGMTSPDLMERVDSQLRV